MRLVLLLVALAIPFPLLAQSDSISGRVPDCVVLLHGLARTDASLLVLEETLLAQGYRVVNSDYDSTSGTVEALAAATLPSAIRRCGLSPRVNFVTHSMGGILLRVWMAENDFPQMGRTVMLAPPNQGSEIVDRMGEVAAFEWINGPSGMQLGTDGLPTRLGPVWPGVGVIAGTRSLNPLWSSLLPGPDDGKVSVASTRVAGMDDHIEMSVTHTFMMNQPIVIGQILTFLRNGKFNPDLTLTDAIADIATVD
ncbi:MAG: alpha/beta hydrolase [Jannaschia helgolandensis]